MIDSRWKNLSSKYRKDYAEFIKKTNDRVHALLEFDPDIDSPSNTAQDSGTTKNELAGVPTVIKDNIAVKQFQLTCASRILERYRAPYTATAVALLQDAGVHVVGKANLDEFGMGSSTTNSAFGDTLNPWDLSRSAGGSSGGTAAAVATGMVPFGLGSDTGGSVRQPASFCGIYGLKPTYGAISRYGLVSYASSLETIGVMAQSIDGIRAAFEVMRKEDPYDQTTISAETWAHTSQSISSNKRIGFLKNVLQLDEGVSDIYHQSIENFRSLGYHLEPIDITLLKYAAPTYYTIATAEASVNLARYDGIRYGTAPKGVRNMNEYIKKVRRDGFGTEVKLRILSGVYVLRSGFQEQYYHQAQRIRSALRQEIDRIFKNVDVILMPVAPTPPFPRDKTAQDSFQQKQDDLYTVLANLAALPALAFPAGKIENLPIGMQVMGPMCSEPHLYTIAADYAQCAAPTPPPQFRGCLELVKEAP